ncbi:MAG: PDZ domain-containing protein [Cyanobacteria bacterium SID2]|nr:PDZ domain-containing protein [Cyanobacteria bacterium SID2]MBP0002485.1 PDZ domain-containing protein [Cyanobacteria bacterium SBC]
MHKRAFWLGLFPIILTFLVWLGWTPPALALTEEQKLVSEVWRIVNRAYVDETFNGRNWWKVRQRALRSPMQNREEAYETIEGMLAKLDDPFTRLLRPDRYRNLQVNTSGELTGVGLQIAIDVETKQLKAIAPIAGAPADIAGIQPGDAILEIDGVATKSLTLDEAAGRMRGPAGTEVKLTIERFEGGSIEDIVLVRDRIALNPVTADLRTVEDAPDMQIGYIRLTQFSANAAEEMAQSIESLDAQGADAFVLDLRNNPGGLLQTGIEIARLWLNDSTIVYTVNRQAILDSFDAGHEALTDAPLVVLVNQGTASASEILAGALQDNGRAQLVGERTFGKGLIQSLFDLSDDSGLAVTVAKYETPNHKDINKLGIMPDYVVKQNPVRRDEVGTEIDRPYQTAVELLTESGVVAKAG